MRRNPIFLLTLTWLMFGMVSAVAGQQNAGPPGPLLRDIVLSGGAWGHELLLRIEGKYSFKAIQATDTTVLVDLKGVRAGGVSKTAQWPSGALTGYRLLQYTDAGRQPVVRVQVDMKRPAPFRVLQERAGLRLIFPESPANSAATGAAQPAARLRQQAAPPIAIGSAQPAKASGGPARVSAVSIQTGANGEALVDVSTTRPTPYRVQQLANPARLVVDFEEARNGARRIYPAHSALLKGVRVGQFRAESPAVVRVVADLVGNPAFDVHAYPGGVRILLKARTQPSQAAVPSPVAALPDPPAKVDRKSVV